MQTVCSFLQKTRFVPHCRRYKRGLNTHKIMQTVWGFLQNMSLYLIVRCEMYAGNLQTVWGFLEFIFVPHSMSWNRGTKYTGTMQTVRGFLQFKFVPHTLCCEMYAGNLQTVWGFLEFTILYPTIWHRTGVQSTREPCKRCGASLSLWVCTYSYGFLPSLVCCPDQNSHKTHASQLTLHLETDWPVSF